MAKEEGGFERSLSRLEDVVQHLENGDLTLDEALALYEEGIALTRRCQWLLSQAEQRVHDLQEVKAKEQGGGEE